MKGIQTTWHFDSMKVILCAALIFVSAGRADEAKDRVAINEVIEATNDPLQRPGLFVKDVDSTVNFDRLIDLHLVSSASVDGVLGIDETWRVLTVPRVVSGTIRFITPDVAIVDGASLIRAPVTLAKTVPLLFVLKKEQTGWRISAVRRIGSVPRRAVQQCGVDDASRTLAGVSATAAKRLIRKRDTQAENQRSTIPKLPHLPKPHATRLRGDKISPHLNSGEGLSHKRDAHAEHERGCIEMGRITASTGGRAGNLF